MYLNHRSMRTTECIDSQLGLKIGLGQHNALQQKQHQQQHKCFMIHQHHKQQNKIFLMQLRTMQHLQQFVMNAILLLRLYNSQAT